MNDVAQTQNSAVSVLQNLRKGLTNVKQAVVVKGGDPFMRLLQDGTWVYGAENVEVETGSRWAVHPMSLMHGWVSWTDYDADDKRSNEIVGEMMVPMTQPAPSADQLSDTGWPWKQQLSIHLACVSGEDKGEQSVYKVTSEGGKRGISELIDAIMTQLDVDPKKPVPVITLDVDHYKHKKWGKTYVPSLNIVSWAAMDDTAPPAEAAQGGTLEEPETATAVADSPASETQPTTRRRRGGAAPQEAQPVANDAQPVADDAQPEQGGTRRRRRRG